MEDLLKWLVQVKSRACIKMFSANGSFLSEVPGGGIPSSFIDKEIERLKAASHTQAKEVALLPAATNRETR